MKVQPIQRIPAYRQVADQLREAIDLDSYPAGKIPTEKELVAQYGVSLITVRKAVELLVKEQRLVKMRGKGTFVKGVVSHNTRARRLTQLLCFVSAPGFEQFSGNFFNRLMLNTQVAAEANNYNALLASSQLNVVPEPLVRGKVDGLILGGTFDKGLDKEATPEERQHHNDKYLVSLARCGFPLVAVSNHSAVAGVHYVYSDYDQMMRKSVAELSAKGHTRIALATSGEKSTAVVARESAFTDAMREAGLTPHAPLTFPEAPWKNPDKAVRHAISYLQGADCPSALVVTNSRFSVFAEAFQSLGHKVGEDISLIGLADCLPGEGGGDPDMEVPSEYTVYAQDVRGLAEQATNRLMSLINGSVTTESSNHVTVPMLYHNGQSVGAPL